MPWSGSICDRFRRGPHTRLEKRSEPFQPCKAVQKCNAPHLGAGHCDKAIKGLFRHMGVTYTGMSCRFGMGFGVGVVDR